MTSQAESPASNVGRRPISAWLLLILLWTVAANFSISLVQVSAFLVSNEAQVIDTTRAFGELGWRSVLIPGAVATAVGVWRRRHWARWAGIGAIITWAAWTVFRPTEYFDGLEGPSFWFARYVSWPLLSIWWGYAFGFSRKARRYFYGTKVENAV